MKMGQSVYVSVREFLKQPRKTGTLVASGVALCKAMALSANATERDIVVEFGPGTGVITAQLLAQGLRPNHLMLVEYNPVFVAKLRKRFPSVKVIEGDAWQIEQHMEKNFPGRRCAAIVSSLPLLNFPMARRTSLLSAITKVLEPQHGRFVQFTYGPRMPVTPGSSFKVSSNGWIFRNFPPAHIWIYQKQ